MTRPRLHHLFVGVWLFSNMEVSGVAPTPKRVVLVTGANKGIGKEIAASIGQLQEPHAVILGCRDLAAGEAAATELRAAGCDAVATRLDLTDEESIQSTRDFCEDRYGRLDALVNNAAICFNDATLYGKVPYTPFEQQAGITIRTNFFGTLAVTQALLPLLRKSAASPRIVIVGSSAGRLRGSPELQAAITSPTLTIAELSSLMNDFVRDAEDGTHAEKGWPNTGYGVSKMGLIALCRVLAREESKIMVNSADPGYCATDQNNNQGVISAKQGAVTPALLAHVAFGGGDGDGNGNDDAAAGVFVTGRHFYDGREVSWTYS